MGIFDDEDEDELDEWTEEDDEYEANLDLLVEDVEDRLLDFMHEIGTDDPDELADMFEAFGVDDDEAAFLLHELMV